MQFIEEQFADAKKEIDRLRKRIKQLEMDNARLYKAVTEAREALSTDPPSPER